MQLPVEYEQKMKRLLQEEYEAYVQSLGQSRTYGLRVNTLKLLPADYRALSPVPLEPVPWTSDGFYYREGHPGRQPFYHAGLYYIQEPSAMYPAAALRPNPGERVLDICAAPGGKSVQLAAALRGEGLLVSNDIKEERVKALVKNMEMAGIRNAVITNETPEKLRRAFPEFFDKILVDAPCSGEGMFRKEEAAVKGWGHFQNAACRSMQEAILEEVHGMLRPGGLILYSTCTFDPLENEQTISWFVERHPEYVLEPLPKLAGVEDGRPEWGSLAENDLEKTARLWPHKVRGEGHFAALLRKGSDGTAGTSRRTDTLPSSYRLLPGPPDEFCSFYRANFIGDVWKGSYFQMGAHLYYLPDSPPNLDGLKLARAGLYLGVLEKGRFKPSHPFALALAAADCRVFVDFERDQEDLLRYLKGETLLAKPDWRIRRDGTIPTEDLPDGWVMLGVEGFPLGWGQARNGVVKNLYPKGWRRTG